MVQNRKTRWRRKSDILTINDNDFEVVRSIKYLGSVMDSTIDETEDIKVIILPVKLITLCTLYLDLNKLIEVIK
jgi:hypothetical protein